MYDPNFIRLDEDETMDFQNRLPEDEPFNYEDFTLSMPADYYIMVAPNSNKLVEVLSHLRPDTFEDVRIAIDKIAIASITIYDEADLYVKYTDDNFPMVLTNGLEEWLNEPQEVEHLDF